MQRGIASGSGDHDVKFWDFELVTDTEYSATRWVLKSIHSIAASRLTRFHQATESSGFPHISIKLSHVHSFTSSSHCLIGLPRDSPPPMFARIPFAFKTSLNHLTFLFFTISIRVSHFSMCSAILLCISTVGACMGQCTCDSLLYSVYVIDYKS